jgi:hypothetical protein
MVRTVVEGKPGLVASDVFPESSDVLVEYVTDLGVTAFIAVATIIDFGVCSSVSLPAPTFVDLFYFLTATVVLATSAPICNAHSWIEGVPFPICSLAARTARRLFTALSLLDIISARALSV